MRVRMGNFVYESADEDAAKTANLRDQIKSLNDQISTLVGEDPERAAGLVGQKSELEKQLVLQVGAAAKAQKATQTPDQASATDRQSNIIAPDQGTPAPIADGTPVSAPSVDSDNNAVVSNDGAIVSMPQLESALKILGAPKRIRVGGKLFEAVSVNMPKKVRIGGYIYEASETDSVSPRKTVEEVGRLLHGKHPKIDTRSGKTEVVLVDDDGNETGVLSDAAIQISYDRKGGYDAVIYGNGWVAENPSEGVWRVWPGESRTGASYRHYEVGEEIGGKKSTGWDDIEESVTREEVAAGDGSGLNHYTDTDKFGGSLIDSLNSLKHRGVCAELADGSDDIILTVGEYKARLILSDATLEAYQEGPGSDLIFRYVVEDAIERTPGYTYIEETSNEGSNRVDVYSADETSELHIYIKQIKSHKPEEDGSVSSEDVID